MSRKIKLTLLLAVLFSLLFSSMAFAYSYYPSYNYNYNTKSYSQPYYNNYYKYTPSYNYNYWNWYGNNTPQQNQPEQTKPEPTQPAPKPEEPAAPAPTAGLTADEQQMINLVNQERKAQGLKPLTVDMQLVKLARMKSQDMIDKNYFSHTSPTYGSPFEMMKNNGVSYRTAGENLAGASSVTTAHKNLMNSDGHRKNILNSNYTHIGIGIVNGGPYGKMYTQLFIGK